MNEAELENFWRFVYERHSIWHRRFILRQPYPWTDDPILRKNKFTNLYRELDPGTKFSVEHILKRDALQPDIVFNVMLYRLMCSIPTYNTYGFHPVAEFDQDEFYNCLCEIYNSGHPVFGNAYLISPYSSMGSDYKFENVARLFGLLKREFPAFWKRVVQADEMEGLWKAINHQYGFGPFLAYQVVVDLTYPLTDKPKTGIFPFSQNEWAKLGPGAKRGFNRLALGHDRLGGLRWLRDTQREAFAGLGLDFPFLRNARGEEVELTLANLQNGLCEFSKFRAIQEGKGKAQRLYIPPERS